MQRLGMAVGGVAAIAGVAVFATMAGAQHQAPKPVVAAPTVAAASAPTAVHLSPRSVAELVLRGNASHDTATLKKYATAEARRELSQYTVAPTYWKFVSEDGAAGSVGVHYHNTVSGKSIILVLNSGRISGDADPVPRVQSVVGE